MYNSTDSSGAGCGDVQELIFWYPSQSLDENEARAVEEHVITCSTCADLLKFSSELKELLVVKHSIHPDAEALVCFVEDKTALDPEQRDFITDHLVVCTECNKQAAVLEEVERDLSGEAKTTTSAPYTPDLTLSPGGRLGRLWESLKAGMFKPVPAAVYFVIAVLAVGLHVLRPTTYPTSDILEGVVFVPDETDRVRQLVEDVAQSTEFEAQKPQVFLLELTGLEAPPSAEDLFTVEFVRKGSSEPTLMSAVKGRVFLDNYTICCQIRAGALAPGEYDVRVVDPAGTTVFRSTLTAN